MRIERYNDRRPPLLEQYANQMGVAQVHAIEIPDRDRAAPTLGGWDFIVIQPIRFTRTHAAHHTKPGRDWWRYVGAENAVLKLE